MATATAPHQAPPTEAEIRAAYHDRAMPNVPLIRLADDLYGELIPFAGPFNWHPAEDTDGELGDAIWADLRPSEAEDLEEQIDGALTRAVERSMAILEEEIVAACMAFAAKHPDARRSVR